MIGLDPDGDERWNAALPFVVDQVPSGAVFNVAPFAFPVGQVWLLLSFILPNSPLSFTPFPSLSTPDIFRMPVVLTLICLFRYDRLSDRPATPE